MFNEERKRRYIDLKESNVTLPYRSLERLFNSTELFEEKWGKDVCEWTTTEIMEYYKYLDVYSLSSIVVCNSNLNLYTNWCLTETLVPDAQNHYLEIRPDMLKACINQEYLTRMIVTRDELINSIDQLPNYTDRFMFLAFFEGICGPEYCEMVSATKDDIDGNVIHLCTGRNIEISDKLKEIAHYAATEEWYQTYGLSGRVLKYSELDPPNLIFKTVARREIKRTNGAMMQAAGRRFDKAKELMGMPQRTTTKSIIVSGKIHFIKQLMEEENLTVEEVIRVKKDVINDKFTSEQIKTPGEFLRRYRQYFD